MSAPTVIVETYGNYRALTLNRPARMNAFTAEMHEALATTIEDAIRDKDCRAILLTGAGRSFCAGQDLSERMTLLTAGQKPDLGLTLEMQYNPLIRRLRSMPLPIVCAVNGVAAGAGANLALACDIVVASRSAEFIQSFIRVGLAPDAGGSYWLPRLVGQARARGLALLGDALPAETALGWGLIWRVYEDDQLVAGAHALCAKLAASPSGAIAMIKRSLDQSIANRLDEQLDLERDLQRELGQSEDYAEGVKAFIEKRKPAFSGRR